MTKGRLKIIIYAFLLAILDQITKYWAIATLKLKPPFLLSNDIGFKYSENTGIAFSLPIPQPLIIFLNIVFFFLIFWVFEKEFNTKKAKAQWGLALIIGGGLGNLIDRFTHGFVVDFISLWTYPIFNLADVYISIGVLLMIVFYGKIKRV